MKFLRNIFSAPVDEVSHEVLLSETHEVPEEQWSALYITNLNTDLVSIKNILSGKLDFVENQTFVRELAPNNKISVLNAVKPGFFDGGQVLGVVVLINATSFSKHADSLLKELYNIVMLIIKHNPDGHIGDNPQKNLSYEELETWLKKQRSRYFFIE